MYQISYTFKLQPQCILNQMPSLLNYNHNVYLYQIPYTVKLKPQCILYQIAYTVK